jgi:integrase/recombinase XerD
MKTVILKYLTHRSDQNIALYFDKDNELISIVKALGAKWSQTNICWYLKAESDSLQKIFIALKGKAWIDYSEIKQQSLEKPGKEEKISDTEDIQKKLLTTEAIEKIETFRMWLKSKRYSESTTSTYTDAVKVFLKFFNEKSISEIKNDDVVVFNNHYILGKKLSASYQNQIVNGIKLFFRTVEETKLNPDLVHRPKRSKVLPNVLSKEEVKAILEASSNVKHRTILSLIYSCGLRCGEALRLKPEHIDSKRKLLIIKSSKGKKDRIAPLSEKIIELLREYYKAYKPKRFLFEGQYAGEPYDARSLQQVLKRSIEKAKIRKPVTLHWLRHSYATHLLESGTDLRYIQEILGHSHSKTTEIYTYVSTKSIQKIKSPFDDL